MGLSKSQPQSKAIYIHSLLHYTVTEINVLYEDLNRNFKERCSFFSLSVHRKEKETYVDVYF